VHGGVTLEHGISVIAPSELNFFLGGKYETLHTIALVGGTASVEFQIYLDRELVYDSGLVENGASLEIELPLKGASELRMIVTDGGNGNTGDSTAWADLWVQ
jgi:hypothetical protein